MTNEIKLPPLPHPSIDEYPGPVLVVAFDDDHMHDYATQAVTEDRAQHDAEHLAELRAYELTVANLREQLAQRGEPANTVTTTAPKEIWLQVSDEASDGNEPFPTPANDYDVTWCQESVLPCEVHYIRSDLARQAIQVPMTDAEINSMWPAPPGTNSIELLVRAVEAHHGIKEKP